MNYKEKYEQALERAKDLMTNQNPPAFDKHLIELVFPELKESEDKDEMIRQCLIEHIKCNKDLNWSLFQWFKPDTIIAWLEKQRKSEEDVLKYAKDYSDRVRHRFREMLQKYPNHKIGCEELAIVALGAITDTYNWLKKQKPQEQESKQEPKFKVGDWFVNNKRKDVFLIKSINTNGYCTLEDIKGNIISPCLPPCESDSHIWTIEDANDGDVLVDKNGCINIYKEPCDKTFYCSHCCCYHPYHGYMYEKDGKFIDAEGAVKIEYAHPATKEQRDLLFSKMKEAGFEWDSDKKEVRKIETPKFKVGDWIIENDCCVREIIQITDYDSVKSMYNCTDEYGSKLKLSRIDEDEYRLWAIQDAKDGDVLVDIYGNIGIFKKHDEFDWQSHCSLGCNGGFQEFVVEHEIERTYPAIKEHRELLFRKIEEAGYEWDAEKKELKKKSTDDVEPKFIVGDKVTMKGDNTVYTIDIIAPDKTCWLKHGSREYGWATFGVLKHYVE